MKSPKTPLEALLGRNEDSKKDEDERFEPDRPHFRSPLARWAWAAPRSKAATPSPATAVRSCPVGLNGHSNELLAGTGFAVRF